VLEIIMKSRYYSINNVDRTSKNTRVRVKLHPVKYFVNHERMEILMATPVVDLDLCIGCGLCSELCPKVFELRDDKAWVVNPNACDTCDCQQAVDSCPVTAISFA
jgi:ferredoxin